MGAAILEQLQRLPEPIQQEALEYLKALVAEYSEVPEPGFHGFSHREDTDATVQQNFYGCIQDATFIRQPQGQFVEREFF